MNALLWMVGINIIKGVVCLITHSFHDKKKGEKLS